MATEVIALDDDEGGDEENYLTQFNVQDVSVCHDSGGGGDGDNIGVGEIVVTNGMTSHTSSRAPSPMPMPCTKCQKIQADSQVIITQMKNQFETDFARLKKDVEVATKTKESIVMKYANSEMEVLKLKNNIENSEKLIKQLNKDVELAHKKHKMLSSERERLSLIIDTKVYEIDALQKEVTRLNQDISTKDFKITWTQNKLREEAESHKAKEECLEKRIQEIETELEDMKHCKNGILLEEEELNESKAPGDTSGEESVILFEADGSVVLKSSAPNKSKNKALNNNNTADTESQNHVDEDDDESSFTVENETDILKHRNGVLIQENNALWEKVQNLEKERDEIQKKILKLQKSNEEHLHQIAHLQSDLAATEELKILIQKEKDKLVEMEKECQSLRQAHADVLNDMSVCAAKEVDLLGYTQQVTEKNVALQSEFSSVEAKSMVLRDENKRLRTEIERLEEELLKIQNVISQENKNVSGEKQAMELEMELRGKQISQLQLQLDEARGEIGVLNKKLNSSVRELSKELNVARKQVKDNQSCSDGLSQSSRTSSSSSLTNGESSNNNKPSAVKQEAESPNSIDKSDQDVPVIPDQQLLIERIVKLQRTLAKKQDKIEFLQEHVKQLVESLQKKSKIITTYAMSQDIETLSSNLAEQNKAEVLKHGGIMASVYGSKQADDAMTLDLSLEINRKLQVVLEDTLLKNITLKDSLNTLGKEISRLTDMNRDLKTTSSEIEKIIPESEEKKDKKIHENENPKTDL